MSDFDISFPGLFIGNLTANLFEAEYRRLDKRIEELTQKNNAIIQGVYPGFLYQGEMYVPNHQWSMAKALAAKSVKLPALAFSLTPEFTDFLKDQQQINLDFSQIRQILLQLVQYARGLQDLRNSLPNCLAPYHEEIKNLPRTKTEEPLSPRFRRQYEKLLPKIEMYCVSRLLY